MKKKFLTSLLCAVMLVSILAGCGMNAAPSPNEPPEEPQSGAQNQQQNGQQGEKPSSNAQGNEQVTGPKAEILELFEEYREDNPDVGNKIMEKLKENTTLVLEALAITPYREQVLTHIGHTIAYAKTDDRTAYDEYMKKLDEAETTNLSEEASAMLRFIRANIEHWQSF